MRPEDETLNEKVREFIIAKRKALGMSQRDLAVALFRDKSRQSYICDIETGKKEMTLNTLQKFLVVLNAGVIIEEF